MEFIDQIKIFFLNNGCKSFIVQRLIYESQILAALIDSDQAFVIIYQALMIPFQILAHTFIHQTNKEIQMQATSLEETFAQLKLTLLLHSLPPQALPLLAVIDSQLPTLIHDHSQLQSQSNTKNTQLQQMTKLLKKNSSKLNRKGEELDQLKAELKRVNSISEQKTQKLAKCHCFQDKHGQVYLPNKFKLKEKRIGNAEVQCQIWHGRTIQELNMQYDALKDRLQQAQKDLMEEKFISRDLSRRLEVLNINLYSEDDDQLKDNSTLDADSHKGDPFAEDEVQIEEWGEDHMAREEKMGCRQKRGWTSRAWQTACSWFNHKSE